jgi:hypothetical protein
MKAQELMTANPSCCTPNDSAELFSTNSASQPTGLAVSATGLRGSLLDVVIPE